MDSVGYLRREQKEGIAEQLHTAFCFALGAYQGMVPQTHPQDATIALRPRKSFPAFLDRG